MDVPAAGEGLRGFLWAAQGGTSEHGSAVRQSPQELADQIQSGHAPWALPGCGALLRPQGHRDGEDAAPVLGELAVQLPAWTTRRVGNRASKAIRGAPPEAADRIERALTSENGVLGPLLPPAPPADNLSAAWRELAGP